MFNPHKIWKNAKSQGLDPLSISEFNFKIYSPQDLELKLMKMENKRINSDIVIYDIGENKWYSQFYDNSNTLCKVQLTNKNVFEHFTVDDHTLFIIMLANFGEYYNHFIILDMKNRTICDPFFNYSYIHNLTVREIKRILQNCKDDTVDDITICDILYLKLNSKCVGVCGPQCLFLLKNYY